MRRAFTSKAPKPGEQTLCVRLAMVEVERSLQNVYSTSKDECVANSRDYDSDQGDYDAGGLMLVSGSGGAEDMELDGSFVHTNVGQWQPQGYVGAGGRVARVDGSVPVSAPPSSQTSTTAAAMPTMSVSNSAANSQSQRETIFENDDDDDDNVSITTDPGEPLPGSTNDSPPSLQAPPHSYYQQQQSEQQLIPQSQSEVPQKVTHATTLRAKGMLVYRIVTLHKALVALFLIQRPIVNVLLGGWKYAMQTLRAVFSRSSTVGNMNQLLSWVRSDIKVKTPEGQPVSSIFNRDRDNNLTAVTLRVSGGNTEYRNLHRDLLELSAPFYEINGSRKLATAARMRASYQCLAPPSF